MKKRWTKKEIEKLKRIYSSNSVKELSRIFNRSITAIYSKASALNLSHQDYNRLFMSNKSRKYTLNKRFFDNIDDEEKAYFLGFLYADGYNNEKKGTIELSLHKKDKDVLNSFKEALETNKPINSYNDTRVKRGSSRVILQLTSDHMSKALARLGCVQAKTKIIRFPFFIRKDLIRHFIRGFFDGDGSVFLAKGKTEYKDKVYHRLTPTISFVSNNSFIIELRATIFLMADICYGNITKDKRTCVYTLSIHNESAIKVLNWMYIGSKVFLKRKNEKYKELLTLFKKGDLI